MFQQLSTGELTGEACLTSKEGLRQRIRELHMEPKFLDSWSGVETNSYMKNLQNGKNRNRNRSLQRNAVPHRSTRHLNSPEIRLPEEILYSAPSSPEHTYRTAPQDTKCDAS
jgi:hypothetical protein